MRDRRARFTITAAVLVAAAAPGLAAAQQPDSAAPSDTVIPLRPLVVSAFPLPLSLAAAPVAASFVDGIRATRARAGVGLGGVLERIPGVQVDNRHNDALDERIAVRGFGARSQFGVRGLAVVVDGVPATMPDGQTALSHLDPNAVRWLEAVRGPASTLVGNAGGGALIIATAPAKEGLSARVLGGADGFLRLEAEAARRVGGALVSGRLARRRTDGFRDHADADKTWASAHVEAPVGEGRLRVAVHGVDYDALNPGSLSDSLRLADPGAAFSRNVDQGTGEEARQAQVGARWTGPGAGAEWDAAAWLLGRDVDNPIPVAVVDLSRVASGARVRHRRVGGPVGWAVGVDLASQWDDRRNFTNEDGAAGDLTLDQNERVTQVAPLAQLALGFDRLSVTAAARWDAVRFSVDDRLVPSGGAPESGARTMSAFSPAIGALWRPGSGAAAFANLSTSFETPTTSELANQPDGSGGFNPDLAPQRTVGIEAGVRAREATYRWEVVAFHARVSEALIPFEAESGRTFFRNAGRARHAGLELAAGATVRDRVEVRAAWSWTRAEFRDFTLDGEDLRGNRLPGVTPHRVEAAASIAGAAGFAEVELRYRSRAAANDDNTAFWPAYVLVDVRAEGPAWRVGGTALRAQAGLLNLADADYVASIVPNAFGGRFFEPGPGRTWYAGL
ncbi:MAG: TonB-dependent receptor, partial [Gemmatimonadota bacterium]